MAVLTSWRSPLADWVEKGTRCSICDERLEVPFLYWQCSGGGELYFCAECCRQCRRGLTADMTRTIQIDEGLKLAPECPTLQTLQ
jgi:hypothetical protein